MFVIFAIIAFLALNLVLTKMFKELHEAEKSEENLQRNQ